MSDRRRRIDHFLADSEWADWDRLPLAGDASARRYERLQRGDRTVILMDAPEDARGGTDRFAALALILKQEGLHPPTVLAHDPVKGIMVLSDLGQHDFGTWLREEPEDAETLYAAATDILLHLHRVAPPAFLERMTPEVGGAMVAVAGEFYSRSDASDMVMEMQRAMAAHAATPDRLALRDFHAENLIWRPAEHGVARVGLLDFQDAFVAPAGYDLVSLLRDARRDVPADITRTMVERFVARTGLGPEVQVQLACLGAQRNLRILGVFARLASVGGKRRYIDLIPRVWRNLMLDLDHPALAALRQAALDILPEPSPTQLQKLRE